jgi:hypothetical protein
MAKISGLLMLQIHYPNKDAPSVAALVGGDVEKNYTNYDVLIKKIQDAQQIKPIK